MTDSDGIDEAFQGQLRFAVTAAAHAAEGIARGWQDARRRAEYADERQARELQSRLAAEQQIARTDLARTTGPGWWDGATSQDVGRVYATALAFEREGDQWATEARQRLDDELRSRYGIDVTTIPRDPNAVAAAVDAQQHREAPAEAVEAVRLAADADAAEQPTIDQRIRDAEQRLADVNQAYLDEPNRSQARHDQLSDAARAAEAELRDLREQAATARDEAASDRSTAQQVETVEHDAGDAATDPDAPAEEASVQRQAEAVADDRGDALYDSAERRESEAARLEAVGVERDAVDARMRTDRAQAKPATDAVRNPQARATQARPRRGQAPRERTEHRTR